MKRIIFLCCCFYAAKTDAQCTPESAAGLPFSCMHNTNASKYIGAGGKENTANTAIMLRKMEDIYSLFDEAFKNTTGMAGSWEGAADNISNEGLVKGYMKISLHPVTCDRNGQYNRSGNATIRFFVYINGFNNDVVRDKNKASGFTQLNGRDTVNGRLLYLIAEKQEEPFKGFPLYYTGWNNTPEQSLVIITKPRVSLLRPISIGDFMQLFRGWTANYHLDPPGSRREVTPERIDKFVQANSADFFAKPCITVWDRSEQLPYIRRGAYVDDATQGNAWVTFNPAYINKNADAASLPFITLQWRTYENDPLTLKTIADFKNNFDFKKLQQMLEPGITEEPVKTQPVRNTVATNITGQCNTTEDAANTQSTCKKVYSPNYMPSKESEKYMNTIYASIIEPAIKSTKGLRGEWSPESRSQKNGNLVSSNIQIYMNVLGCTTSHTLYEKNESGMVLNFGLNSLWQIGELCTHKEKITRNGKTQEETVTETVEGRPVYLLKQQAESEKYGRCAYYRKEEGSKYLVIAKGGLPLFLPVSIKDVLLLKKAALLAEQANQTNAANIEYYRVEITNIDNYIQTSPATQTGRPFIGWFYPGKEPVDNKLFKNLPTEGPQYVTLNPAYFNPSAPAAAPQFMMIEMRSQGGNAVTLSGLKAFEDHLDFNKLLQVLQKG